VNQHLKKEKHVENSGLVAKCHMMVRFIFSKVSIHVGIYLMPLAAFIELIQHPTVAVSNADGLQAKWATRETEAETEAGNVTGNLRGPQCHPPSLTKGLLINGVSFFGRAGYIRVFPKRRGNVGPRKDPLRGFRMSILFRQNSGSEQFELLYKVGPYQL